MPKHDNDDDLPCLCCLGDGIEEYWVGTYGTPACDGIRTRTCTECEGTGVAYYA